MDRERKLELIQRSLALRHKLKVHESMEAPTNHEELSYTLLAKWELEDELRAVEELLAEGRLMNVQGKRELIEGGVLERKKKEKVARESALNASTRKTTTRKRP